MFVWARSFVMLGLIISMDERTKKLTLISWRLTEAKLWDQMNCESCDDDSCFSRIFKSGICLGPNVILEFAIFIM